MQIRVKINTKKKTCALADCFDTPFIIEHYLWRTLKYRIPVTMLTELEFNQIYITVGYKYRAQKDD